MIKVIVCIFTCLLLNVKGANAYEVPENACKVDIRDNRLGSISIIIPCNSTSSLSLKNHLQIINVSSGTITGYFTYNNEDYTVRFSPYEYGTYRLENDKYTYSLDIQEITDKNFNFRSQMSNIFENDVFMVAYFVIVGGLLWMIYIKR